MWRNNPLFRAIGMVTGYIACILAVKLVFVTLIAYALIRSVDQSESSLQRMGDAIQANQVLTYGGAALLFVIVLQFLHPLTTTKFSDVFDVGELRKHFTPNAINGLVLTVVLVLATSIGGYMSYLGVYIQIDEVVWTMASAVVFGLGLFIMIVVEEYILRHVFEPMLEKSRGPLFVAATSSLLFLVIKLIQFDVSWTVYANLVLFNLTLSMIARHEKSYMASASFAATFMVLVHVFFGLPFMGQDMPGLLLLRGASDTRVARLLSGGMEGPESGLVLGILLLIYLYLPQTRARKVKA